MKRKRIHKEYVDSTILDILGNLRMYDYLNLFHIVRDLVDSDEVLKDPKRRIIIVNRAIECLNIMLNQGYISIGLNLGNDKFRDYIPYHGKLPDFKDMKIGFGITELGEVAWNKWKDEQSFF